MTIIFEKIFKDKNDDCKKDKNKSDCETCKELEADNERLRKILRDHDISVL